MRLLICMGLLFACATGAWAADAIEGASAGAASVDSTMTGRGVMSVAPAGVTAMAGAMVGRGLMVGSPNGVTTAALTIFGHIHIVGSSYSYSYLEGGMPVLAPPCCDN